MILVSSLGLIINFESTSLLRVRKPLAAMKEYVCLSGYFDVTKSVNYSHLGSRGISFRRVFRATV